MGGDMYAGLFNGCPTGWRSTTVSFLHFGIYGHFPVGPPPNIQSIIIPNTDWFYAKSDGGVRPSQYFLYIISNISLHCS